MNENKSTNSPFASRILTDIARLKVDSQYRNRRGLFFVEGIRNFLAAADRQSIQTLIYNDTLLKPVYARQRMRHLRRMGVRTLSVTPEQFRSISSTPRASGIGAVVKQQCPQLHQIDPHSGTCWIMLSDVRSPGNFGSMIRTSAAVNGAGFLLVDSTIDPFDANVVRASMGAIFKQRFVQTNRYELQGWIHRHQLQVVGASPDGSREYDRFNYKYCPIIALGEERNGLDSQQRQLCSSLVRIPTTPDCDSLNIAVAAGVMMYEVVRQQRKKEGQALGQHKFTDVAAGNPSS